MAGIALLSQLLAYKCQLHQAEMDQIFWTEKYDSNHQALTRWEKEQAAWDKAYEKAFDCDAERGVQYQGNTYYTAANDMLSERYAAMVTGFSQDQLNYIIDGLTGLDNEYDLHKTSLDALITEINANIDATKNQTGTALQDTGMFGQS